MLPLRAVLTYYIVEVVTLSHRSCTEGAKLVSVYLCIARKILRDQRLNSRSRQLSIVEYEEWFPSPYAYGRM